MEKERKYSLKTMLREDEIKDFQHMLVDQERSMKDWIAEKIREAIAIHKYNVSLKLKKGKE